ncbi:hypothetical protein [Pseudomonas nunensis]|uniref:Uncharacterized protein n=1 Tax=Pseudomonas nunensis TaxID=2961896 RepID=A0ABY5E7H5_9PSED|nr:hypothetical protein [Pseudomonas nunensis]KPN91533.1 hypothetical protein AL066_14755 [Pseudomonas nunensis]MCL5229784.1 hypothetical protein [Pseudomonas nunensis]UTO11731.1 hypothetical protein NK667_16150 [Pseudomonas nunensis]
MAGKLNLPKVSSVAKSATASVERDAHTLEKLTIETSAKNYAHKMQTAQAAIGLIGQFVELGSAYIRYKDTEAQWVRRAQISYAELEKAKVQLAKTQSDNQIRMRDQEQLDEILQRIFDFFDEQMGRLKQIPLLSPEENQMRAVLLDLTGKMVELRKG